MCIWCLNILWDEQFQEEPLEEHVYYIETLNKCVIHTLFYKGTSKNRSPKLDGDGCRLTNAKCKMLAESYTLREHLSKIPSRILNNILSKEDRGHKS